MISGCQNKLYLFLKWLPQYNDRTQNGRISFLNGYHNTITAHKMAVFLNQDVIYVRSPSYYLAKGARPELSALVKLYGVESVMHLREMSNRLLMSLKFVIQNLRLFAAKTCKIFYIVQDDKTF
jgi:hypothetical protein